MPLFDSLHLALSIDKLEQLAIERFDVPLNRLIPDGRVICTHGGPPLAALRQLLERVSSGPGGVGSRLSLSPAVEDELTYLVLACLGQGGREYPRGMRGKRLRVLERALKLIDIHPGIVDGTMDSSDIAVEAGVSRRTLEHAFRDGLGLGPAAYLKARRLCLLGRKLYRDREGSARVADLAHSQGFQHLGQMASDYRAMFGELPSETLRRGRTLSP